MSLATQRNTGALAAKKTGARTVQAPINFSGTGQGATAAQPPQSAAAAANSGNAQLGANLAPVGPAPTPPATVPTQNVRPASASVGQTGPAGAMLGAGLSPRLLNPAVPVSQNQEPVRRPFNMGNAEWAAQARAAMPRTLQRSPATSQPAVLNPVAGWTRGGAGTVQGSIQDTNRGPVTRASTIRDQSQNAAELGLAPASQSTLNSIAANPSMLNSASGRGGTGDGSGNMQVVNQQPLTTNASVLAPNTTNMAVGGAGTAQGSVQGAIADQSGTLGVSDQQGSDRPAYSQPDWLRRTGMVSDGSNRDAAPADETLDPPGTTGGFPGLPGGNTANSLAFDAGRLGIDPLVQAGLGMSKTVNTAMDQYKKDQGIDQIEGGYDVLQNSGRNWMDPARAAAANRAAEQGLETSVNNQRDAQVRQLLDMQNRGGRTGSGSLQGAYTSAANAISEGKRGLTQDAFGRDLEASKTGAAQMSAALEAKYGIKRDTSVSPEDFIQMLMEYVPDIADSLTPG